MVLRRVDVDVLEGSRSSVLPALGLRCKRREEAIVRGRHARETLVGCYRAFSWVVSLAAPVGLAAPVSLPTPVSQTVPVSRVEFDVVERSE